MTKLMLLLTLLSFSIKAEVSNEELERRINILTDEVTSLKAYQMNVSTNEQAYGLSPSASKVYFIPKGLSIGGYGEILYNHKRGKNQDGDDVDIDPTAEAYRYVMYLGYKFNDKWVLNTEIELEHVNEIYNEFMYVDYLNDPAMNFRFGLMLLPVGFINEQHEPVLFPSVQRPDTERLVIPSTWREIGAGAFGKVGNLDYKFYVVNGGDADDIKPSNFRGARKKGGEAGSDDNTRASTGAAVLRVDYNTSTQSLIGFSAYKGQASSVNEENLETSLYDFHAQYQKSGWRFRLLYTELNYDNVDKWNDENNSTLSDGVTAQSNLQKKMQAGYLEVLYNVWNGKSAAALEPFYRYERINLNADFNEDDYGYNGATDYYTHRVGIAYKPTVRLTFKADYAEIKNEAESGVDEFNLGMGFNF
ncbi:hypothetical protein N9N67_10275 [Bacteriovoracaceae bacterium]|nr:hypothetical protein [Bacteriovoracaceae bacterium]